MSTEQPKEKAEVPPPLKSSVPPVPVPPPIVKPKKPSSGKKSAADDKPQKNIKLSHKPLSAEKTIDSKNSAEFPEFEYEYLQEKLYLEEIFNTLYLSFDNPNQQANTAQYMQLLQQERMMMEAMQNKPMQSGMAFEDQSAQAMQQPMSEEALIHEMEQEAQNLAKSEGLIPDQANTPSDKNESPEEKPQILPETKKENQMPEIKDESDVLVKLDPEIQRTPPANTNNPKIASLGSLKPKVLSEAKKKKESSKEPTSSNNTKVLRSIYLSFPLKKAGPKNAGVSIPGASSTGILSAQPLPFNSKNTKNPASQPSSDQEPNICVFFNNSVSYNKGEGISKWQLL